MSINPSPVLLAGSILALYLLARMFFWIYQGFRIHKPGYVPPTPTNTSRYLRLILGRFFVWLLIGPVRIVGESNLGYWGRLIALGNHQTERDAVLSLLMMGSRPLRYFIANNQATGIRAPLVAYTGGIIVRGEDTLACAAALLAAIRTMRREGDTSFMIFPQGELKRNNIMIRQDFKPGTAMLGKKVAQTSELPVAFLPFGIYFDRNPEHATPFHRTLNKFGIKWFRRFFGEVTYGATIVIGSPIPTELLTDDYKGQATDTLFEAVSLVTAQSQRIGAQEDQPK